MTARGNRRRSAAVSCVVALLAVSGCQSSSDGADDGPAAGDATTSSSSPVPTSSAPVVEPADGRLITVPGASMRGLSSYRRYADYGIVQGYGDKQSAVSLSPNLTAAPSLDAYAREYVREHGGTGVMRRLDDVVVGGRYNAWHLLDLSEKASGDFHYFGVMFLDSAWLIRITRFADAPGGPLAQDEFQQVVDSLLASFRTDLD